jgi:hypothetical protein
MGVLRSSVPSRKKGRFSGYRRANRSLAAIWATSDSTWEKSGFTAASMAVLGLGVHFASKPTSPSTGLL